MDNMVARVRIKCPGYLDIEHDFYMKNKILSVKNIISGSIAGNPLPNDQRLIYNGGLIDDEATLSQIFNIGPSFEVYTLHLAFSSQFNTRLEANKQKMLQMYELYCQYVCQYMAAHQTGYGKEITGFGQEGEQDNSQAAAQGSNVGEGGQDANQVAVQGANEENDLHREGEGENDFLSHLYLISRLALFISVLYFYSSPVRFLSVVGILLAFYLFKLVLMRRLNTSRDTEGEDTNDEDTNNNRTDGSNYLVMIVNFLSLFFVSIMPEHPEIM